MGKYKERDVPTWTRYLENAPDPALIVQVYRTAHLCFPPYADSFSIEMRIRSRIH